MKKDYWIAVKVIEDENTVFISNNNPYIITKMGSDLNFNYFLVPETNKNIVITSITYDNNFIELIENDTESKLLKFRTKKKGETYISITTKNNGNTSTCKIQIQ